MDIYSTPMINNSIICLPLSVAIVHCVCGQQDLVHKQTNDFHTQRRHSLCRLRQKNVTPPIVLAVNCFATRATLLGTELKRAIYTNIYTRIYTPIYAVVEVCAGLKSRTPATHPISHAEKKL